MKAGQRLMVMLAGLLIFGSSNMAWLNNIKPSDANFGHMLDTTISTLFGSSVVINSDAINQISMALVLVVVGAITMAAAALGSKGFTIACMVLNLLVIIAWFISSGLGMGDLFGQFGSLGLGTQLAMLSCLLSLLAVALPKLKALRHAASA